MPQQSRIENFNETAAKAFVAFPHELGRLVVLAVPAQNTPVFISPAIAEQLSANTAAIKEAVAEAHEILERTGWTALASSDHDVGGTLVDLIAMPSTPIADRYTERFTQEMMEDFAFDHELGHLILPNGQPCKGASENKSESAADAFAMLRHIQRYGKETDLPELYYTAKAAHIVVKKETTHYTSDTIQRVIEKANELGDAFLQMPLEEVAKIAAEIANEKTLDDFTLGYVRLNYLGVTAGIDNAAMRIYDGDPETCQIVFRRVLAVMEKEYRDEDVFNAGKRYLSHPRRKAFMVQAAKTDGFWRRALAFVETGIPRFSPGGRAAAPSMRF